MSFSADIESYIEATFDHVSDLPLQEQQEIVEGRRFADEIVTEVIRTRETLGEIRLTGIEDLVRDNRDLMEHFLNEHFTRKVIAAIPGYVARTLKLSQMEAADTPSTVTNTYIREATRTYILGFPQASIALSRAALEQGLKERLGYQLTGTFIRFQDLLAEARSNHLLDYVTEQAARDVANTADDVLHENPTDLSTAYEVLNKLRGVLQHIYSTEGHL